MEGITDYGTKRLSDLKRFLQFTKERFDPLSHFVMLALFLWTHTQLLKYYDLLQLAWPNMCLVYLGVVVFFFKLRLYDEIKDYDTDLVINPTRPLPRKLVSVLEVKRGIELCLLLEFILFMQAGPWAILAIAVASGYSLLMYHEFFIGNYIRPHLTTYATSHTVVTLFLSLAIFQALSGKFLGALPIEFFLFSLMSWLLFNIFELGRKTFQAHEEKDQVESYSKVWTRPGALILVLLHAWGATWLAQKIIPAAPDWFGVYLWSILGLMGVIGLGLVFLEKSYFGKIYRGFSSFYIVLIYSGLGLALI